MPDKDAGTPRVFLIRHGETEWTKSGRYTGATDIPLTPHGELQVDASSRVIIGPSKIIQPDNLAKVFISPRTRAQRTFEILFDESSRASLQSEGRTEITQDIREWEYGLYEGLLTKEIREGRKSRGLDGDVKWDIWHHGCEGGESPAEVAERLDRLIEAIKEIQGPFLKASGGKETSGRKDVIVIAHGHILRAFAKRWVQYELKMRLPMMLEPGAVGTLSYEHHSVEEPALLLGVNMGGNIEE